MEWESLLEHYRLMERISETQLEIYRKLERNEDPETREFTRDMAVPVVVRVDFIKRLQEELGATLDLREIVCPMPSFWIRFYELGLCWLKETVTSEELEKSFPKSWVLSGWEHSNDSDKQDQFLQQLAFLDEHGLLKKAIKLLHTIPKDGYGWKTFGARGFKSAIRKTKSQP